MKQDITSLIEKLENARGGSRELDIPLGQALGLIDADEIYTASNGLRHRSGNCDPWPEWTESLDAALALTERVLPDHTCRLDMDARPRAYIFMVDGYTIGSKPTEWVAYADAPTVPLALCIAMLRAKTRGAVK